MINNLSYTASMNTYNVNGTGFDSFFAAIAFAKPLRANVVQNDNGAIRWTPAPVKTGKPAVRHVLINADGTTTEFRKVRQ